MIEIKAEYYDSTNDEGKFDQKDTINFKDLNSFIEWLNDYDLIPYHFSIKDKKENKA